MTVCKRLTCSRKAHAGKMQGFCHAHYERADRGYVDSGPVKAHVKKLRDKGYGIRELARTSGLSHSAILHFGDRVQVSSARAILNIPIPETLVDEGCLLPSFVVARRVRALMAIGHSQRAIADAAGMDYRRLNHLLFQEFVSSTSAVLVAEAYDRLHMTPGTSRRSVLLAKRMGWGPPLSWDDIDDPDETPNTGETATVSWLDRYRELQEMGVPEHRIPERMGIEPGSVKTQLARYGINAEGAA